MHDSISQSDASFPGQGSGSSKSHGISRFERSLKRTGKLVHRLNQHERNFALFRFGLVIAGVAVLTATFNQIGPAGEILAVLALMLLIGVLAAIHEKMRLATQRWKGIHHSYECSHWRYSRNLTALAKSQNPVAWNEDELAAHPYALDLDVPQGIFTWMNSCVLPSSSHKLARMLLEANHEGKELTAENLKHFALQLVSFPRLLRRLEALRLLQEPHKRHVANETDLQMQALRTSPKTWLGFALVIASIVAWVILIFPDLVAHRFAHFELGKNILYYLPFPLLVIWALSPSYERAGKRLHVLKFSEMLLKEWQMLGKHVAFQKLSIFSDASLNEIVWIRRLTDFLSLRGNPVLWAVMNVVFPTDALVSAILELRLRTLEKSLKRWSDDLILLDLSAAFARLLQEDKHMHLQEHASSSDHTFSCTEMMHPLLPPHTRVGNCFELSPNQRCVLLTGSNMSGKSTFLRSFGANLLLHKLGAPVCARNFSAPLDVKLVCAIRIHDSLAEKTSFFYAEVKRLKYILETVTNHKPTVFLIDEIFKGTNNVERLVGSESVIQALVRSDAFGIVTTHDLSLAKLEESEAHLVNMHFREKVQNGVLEFDYKLRQGPCPTTNALIIMRLAGLPVPATTGAHT